MLDESALAALYVLQSTLDLLKHAQPLLSSSHVREVIEKGDLVALVESQLLDVVASLDFMKNNVAQESPASETSAMGSFDAAPSQKTKAVASRGVSMTRNDPPQSSDLQAEAKPPKEANRMIKAARAQEAFVLLDADQSGLLEVDELRVALKYMGVAEEELDEVLERVTERVESLRHDHGSHFGKITLEEFTTLFTSDPVGDETLKLLQEGLGNITDDLLNEFNRRTVGMVIGNDKWLLLDPRSKLSTNWDIYVAILLIITIFTMPLSMAFVDAQRTLVGLDLLADVTFVLDIIKHFNTGYTDQFDFTIMDRRKVRWHYVASWFIPDLLSSIPIEILELLLGAEGNINDLRATKALKLLRLSRIAKVFRIFKLSKLSKLFREAQDRLEDHFLVQLNEAWLAISRLFLSLLVLAHWIGCINFMICREYGFPVDSWVVAADLVHATIGTQYSWCFFKALMEMIGLGFESPPLVNTVCYTRTDWCTIEHWITLICLYIGSIFYALLISSVSFVMANSDKGGANLSEILWGINEYLKNKKVPVPIKDKVRSFFRIQFSEGKHYDEEEILSVLPPSLRSEIMFFNHRQFFESVPLLSDGNEMSPKAFVSRLAPVLKPRLVFAGETIFEEDMTGAEMFFILSGIVQILSQFCEPVVKAIADGCYFGDVACLIGCKRTGTTRARTNTVLNVLRKRDLLVLLTDYPQVLKNMLRVAKARKLRMDSLDASRKCPPLLDDQFEDEEDAGTKYFTKLETVSKNQKNAMKVLSSSNLSELVGSVSPEKLPGAGAIELSGLRAKLGKYDKSEPPTSETKDALGEQKSTFTQQETKSEKETTNKSPSTKTKSEKQKTNKGSKKIKLGTPL